MDSIKERKSVCEEYSKLSTPPGHPKSFYLFIYSTLSRWDESIVFKSFQVTWYTLRRAYLQESW